MKIVKNWANRRPLRENGQKCRALPFENKFRRQWKAIDGGRSLKLHGSICYYADDVTSHQNLFTEEPVERAQKLFGVKADLVVPPMLFPWEIMNENGFAGKNFFQLSQHRDLNFLFRGIWERARREVQAEDRISFVGLSMHSFLLDGLKYLFNGKEGKTEICVANPDSPIFIEGQRETHWQIQQYNSANAVANALGIIAPKMGRWGRINGRHRSEGDMTIVKSFEDFIKKQMLPFDLP